MSEQTPFGVQNTENQDEEDTNISIEILKLKASLQKEELLSVSDLDEIAQDLQGEPNEAFREMVVEPKELNNLVDLCLMYEDIFRSYKKNGTKELQKLRQNVADTALYKGTQNDISEKLKIYQKYVELLDSFKTKKDPNEILQGITEIGNKVEQIQRNVNSNPL